jgi:hypothetical protein
VTIADGKCEITSVSQAQADISCEITSVSKTHADKSYDTQRNCLFLWASNPLKLFKFLLSRMIKIVQTSLSVFVATQEGKSLLWPTRSRETKESCVLSRPGRATTPSSLFMLQKKAETRWTLVAIPGLNWTADVTFATWAGWAWDAAHQGSIPSVFFQFNLFTNNFTTEETNFISDPNEGRQPLWRPNSTTWRQWCWHPYGSTWAGRVPR